MTSSRVPCCLARPCTATTLVLAAALAGCTPPTPTADRAKPRSDPGHDPSQTPSSSTATPAITTEAAQPSADAAPTGPARTFVIVENAGVFVIGESGWDLAHTSREPIRDMLMHDGALHVLSSSGVQRVDSLGAVSVIAAIDPTTYKAIGEPRALALDGARAFVLGQTGVGQHASSAWTIAAHDQASQAGQAPPMPAPSDLALAPTHEPWLRWGATVSRFDGRTWPGVELPLDPGTSALALVRVAESLLIYGSCQRSDGQICQLLQQTDVTTRQALNPIGCPGTLVYARPSQNQRFVAVAGDCGLWTFDLDHPTAQPTHTTLTQDGVVHPPTALAIDDTGRAWIGTPSGLTVISPDTPPLELPLARLTDIAAPIRGVMVTGDGPTPPPLGPERHGGLRGKLVLADNTPIALAPVELCQGQRDPQPQPEDSASPCQDVPNTTQLTTDEQGQFEAPNLVLGGHTIAVNVDGHWHRAKLTNATMRANMTGNVGKITIDR